MTELRQKINNIVEEKNTKVVPENIRAGRTMFNVDGTFSSDANATAKDIAMNKTAYVNGEKIEGTLLEPSMSSISTDNIIDTGSRVDIEGKMPTDYLFRKNSIITYNIKYPSLANAIGLTSDKLVKGNTVIGVVGTHENTGSGEENNAMITPVLGSTFNVRYALSKVGKLDMTGITSMSAAFSNCNTLISIEEISNTNSVTNMYEVFGYCKQLVTAPEMDTSNVTDFRYAFRDCLKLKNVPLYNLSKITSTNGLFSNCSELESVPQFDLSSVTDVSSMFGRCTKLKTVPYWDFSKVTNINGFIQFCSSLEEIPEYDFSSVKSMSNFCYKCDSLKRLPSFNTPKNTTLYYSFYECYALEEIGEVDASSVNNVSTTFYCPKLTTFGGLLNLGKAYTQKTVNASSYGVSLSSSNQLTHESLMNVINKIYDLNLTYNVANGGTLYTQSLKLGSTNLSKLTAEEIAIATAKGWTVS